MSTDDTKTRTGTVIPIAHNDQGDLRGIMVEKDGAVSLTQFTRVPEGRPIMGDNVTRLARIEGSPYLAAEITPIPGRPEPSACEPEPRSTSSARVGYSRAYAEGWDRIFGKKDVGEA